MAYELRNGTCSPEHRLASLGAVVLTPLRLTAVATILGLTALNVRGLDVGRSVQNVFTVAKVGVLLAVVALGLVFADPATRAANLSRHPFATGLSPAGTVLELGAAMVGARRRTELEPRRGDEGGGATLFWTSPGVSSPALGAPALKRDRSVTIA